MRLSPTPQIYHGDKLTDPDLKGKVCYAVLRDDGKSIIGQRPRNQLVQFEDGALAVVLARRKKKISPESLELSIGVL